MFLMTDFTSFAEIRSVLGLSAKELTDEELSQEIYSNFLEYALDDVTLPDDEPGPGLLKNVFLALPVEAERTVKQQTLYNLTRLFATYASALVAARAVSMSAKTISDSKSTLSRFSSESSYKIIVQNIEKALLTYKNAMENINEDSVTVPGYFTIVPPATDVVTAE